MARATPDLTGHQFARLTALHRVHYPGERDAFWACRCTCGTLLSIASCSLRSGNTKSCGCLKREHSRKNFVTHGYARGGQKTPEYMAWTAAKGRCYNTRNKSYADYGGRGIYMCAAWRSSFSTFYRAVGDRPSRSHSLGRINNDGPYAPGNCRWETVAEQTSNTRQSRYIVVGAQRVALLAAAQASGISTDNIRSRISRGWSTERALTEPIRRW